MSAKDRTREAFEQEIARLNATVAALAESEVRFRDAFERSTVGQSLTGPDGKLLKVNQSFADMLGLSIQELQQANVADITHPDDIAKTQELFRCLLTNERTTYGIDKRYRHRDGHIVFADVSVTLLRDGAGAPRHFVTTIVDITERKVAERQVLEKNALMTAVLESVDFSNCFIDSTLHYGGFNRAYANMVKAICNVDIQVGASLVEFQLASEAFQPSSKSLERALQGETVFESVTSGDEGHCPLYFEVNHNPVRTDAGEIIGVSTLIRDVTTQKQAADELRFNNLVHLTQQEASIDGILVVDSMGKIVSSNQRFADMWGIPSHVIESKSDGLALQSVLDKLEDSQEFTAKVNCLYATDEKSRDEIALKDGRTFERYSAPMLGVDGERFGRGWYFRDITDRKQAEKQSEMLARFPGENPSPILRIMPDGILQYANPSARPLLLHWGCEPGQSLPAEWVMRVAEAMATGKRHESEVNCSGRSYLIVIRPLQTAGYVNVYGHDMTDRKRAEHALKNSETRLRAILDTTPFPVALVDARDQDIEFWSRSALALFGHTAPTASEWFKIAYPDPDYRREVIERWKPALEIARLSKQPVNAGEYRVTCRDGSVRNCELYVAFLPDGMIVTFNDITERKRAEAEREKLEEQLRASQKIEAIGRLAGGVAHDFNNLLSVIQIYNGFAMDGATDSVRCDLIEVQKAADRGVALVQQLLAFSRKQVLRPVPLNLSNVVAGVQAMLRRVLGEDIDLAQRLVPNVGLTMADPSQIEQVIMNLVVNARDAMPEGGRLTIETSNEDIDEQQAASHMPVKPGSYVQLVVADTGIGMDEQTRERIFEPFFTTKSTGTGLGLATVYGIVSQSGGYIRVHSEPGTGTTFKIYLPRAPSTSTTTTTIPPPTSRRNVGAETILVVEDDEALLKAAKRTLDAAGYKVLTAANGGDALMACARHKGDLHLLLTDVVMPQMSGKALADELSNSQPTLKVLYMSGYTDNIIDQHGVLPEGTHFIGKPFTTAALTRKVREVLDLT